MGGGERERERERRGRGSEVEVGKGDLKKNKTVSYIYSFGTPCYSVFHQSKLFTNFLLLTHAGAWQRIFQVS